MGPDPHACRGCLGRRKPPFAGRTGQGACRARASRHPLASKAGPETHRPFDGRPTLRAAFVASRIGERLHLPSRAQRFRTGSDPRQQAPPLIFLCTPLRLLCAIVTAHLIVNQIAG